MKLITGIVIAAAAAALLWTAVASGGSTHSSNVVFDDYDDNLTEIRFFGHLTSPGPAKCSEDRKVHLFMVLKGGDEKVGTTRTDSFEHWSLLRSTDGLVSGADYYAKVKKLKLGGGAKCAKDMSNLVNVILS
jgi:hypothetical protein